MNDEWQTEIVNSSFVLGVKRVLDDSNPERWTVTMSMTSYIEDMAGAFTKDLEQVIGRRKVSTPFPEGVILSKSYIPREGECKANIERGYQRLVGSLLWCVRHVMPICLYGCSQLCKLMAAPTDEAWMLPFTYCSI